MTVLVLLIGGFGIADKRADHFKETPEEAQPSGAVMSDMRRSFENQVFFLATDIISSQGEPNLVEANILFKEAVSSLIDDGYDPYKADPYRTTITGHDLEITIMPMSVQASACTDDTSRSGSKAPFTVPTYYRVRGSITFLFEDMTREVGSFSDNMTIDRLVPDVRPFVSVRLDELEANGKSELTDIGRMVRYMLTTLVRFRTVFGTGSGPYDTEKNLLNEGDVELAVNMAVLLEQARLFGSYDKDAVDAIDHYFFYANDPEEHLDEVGWQPFNPTTLRPWGSAEKKNYGLYSQLPTGNDRTLGSIFDTYVHEGAIDPADLMALYLRLDVKDKATVMDPTDGTSILHSKFLMDGRYQDDRTDQSHLRYLADVSPRDMLFMDPSGDYSQTYVERLSVDQYPDYLIVGSDIKVSKEITTPYRWMTNAKLKEGSRTGGVPPPQPPPEHDWVMLWEFRIRGDFQVAVGRDPSAALADGTGPGPIENRTISLDIPINIFTPLTIRPMNSAMFFTNLNTGSPPGATYNFTLESLAYEHFSNETWSKVKGLVSPVLEDAIRLVKGATCPYHGLISTGNDLTSLKAGLALEDVDPAIWTSVDDLVTKRLSGVGLSTQILKPLLNFEYFMDMDLIVGPEPGIEYELALTTRTHVGDLSLTLQRSATGPGGWIELDSQLKVDGLLEAGYELDWGDDRDALRLQGTGTVGTGTWSIPRQEKGPSTIKAVYVETGGSFAMMVIPDKGMADPIGQVVSAIPDSRSGLGADAAKAFILDFSKALKDLSMPSATVLFSDGTTTGGWHGLHAENAATVTLMLDWVGDHAGALVKLSEEERVEAGAIGMAAADELGKLQGLEVTVFKGNETVAVPIRYYADASQLFQADLMFEPLKARQNIDVVFEVEGISEKMAFRTTLTFTEYSEVFLDDLEET